MKKIVVCVQKNGRFVVGPNGMVWQAEETFEFDWVSHEFAIDEDNQLLKIEEGLFVVMIVPLDKLNYVRVVDIPDEEEPDETH